MCSLAPHMASPRDTCEDATAKWGDCFGCFAFWQRWPSQPSQRRLLGYLKNPECKITRRCKRRAENGCMSWGSVRHGTKMRWNYCILTNRCLFVYPIFFFSWQQDVARKSWQIWDWKTMMSWRNVNLWKEELLNVIELEDFWCSFESFVHFKDCFLMLLAPLNFSQLFPTSPKGVTSGVVSGWMRLMLKFCQIWIKPARRCNVHNGAPCCDDVCKWHRSLLSGVVGCGWEGWGWKMLKIRDDWLGEKALAVPTFHSNFS